MRFLTCFLVSHLWLKYKKERWRNHVHCVTLFWMIYERNVNDTRVKCSHPNSIISIIPTRTERTLFRLSKAEGTGHKPCPSLLFFSLSFQTEEKRTGNEAEKSFFRRSWFSKEKRKEARKALEIKEKRRKRQKKRKAESLPGKKKEKEPPVEGGAERGKVRKNERSKRNRKLMVNLS